MQRLRRVRHREPHGRSCWLRPHDHQKGHLETLGINRRLLIGGPQAFSDRGTRLVGQRLQSLMGVLHPFGRYRRMNYHLHRRMAQIQGAYWQHVERSVERDRYDGKMLIDSHLISPFLKATHLARLRAGAFGENHDRSPFAQAALRIAHALRRSLGRGIVYKDEASRPTSRSHERDLADTGFHHPFDRDPQETINQEDVERPLMVGHEDVRAASLNMLHASHTHRTEGQIASQPRPYHTGIIGKDALTTQHAADDDRNSCEERQYQENGYANQPKIDSEEDSAHVQLDFGTNIAAKFNLRLIFLAKYFLVRVIIALFAVAKEYKYINIYIHE